MSTVGPDGVKLPDNRIRFSTAPINFDELVGTTGQAHDTFPAPRQQPRYDWMRMALIGLLSQQSSHSPPTQYREGTPWFDLNTNTLMVWSTGMSANSSDGAWVSVSQAIQLDTDADGNPVTLQDVYATIKTLLGFRPTASFGGHSTNNGVTTIPIPKSLQGAAGAGSQPFVWVDGLLVDPRQCAYAGGATPSSITLGGGEVINSGQSFNVLMLAIDPSMFSLTEVIL